MSNSALPYWLALMVLVAAGYGGWKFWQVQQFEMSRAEGGIEFEGPPLEEFELTTADGKTFRSADMKGKVWVATFFFATCQGSCPRLNANIKHLNSLEELKEVTWVSITVDPDTDTLERLQGYSEQFSADPNRWNFCRGDFKYTRRIGQDIMKMPVTWQGHNDFGVVIGKDGEIKAWQEIIKLSQIEKMRQVLLECLEEEFEDSNESGEDEPETTAA